MTMPRDLNNLHPLVQNRFKALLNELREELELDIQCSTVYRDVKEQNAAFEGGFSTVKYPMSWHNNEYNGKPASLAIDIFNNEKGLEYDIDWNIVGNICYKYGCEWGGNWKSFPDKPHIQYTEGKTRKFIMDNPNYQFQSYNNNLMDKIDISRWNTIRKII